MNKVYIDVISWIATGVSIFGQILINRKNINAYYLWIIGCILWGAVGILSKNYALLTMYIIYLGLNIEGLIKWMKDKKI